MYHKLTSTADDAMGLKSFLQSLTKKIKTVVKKKYKL